MVNKEESIVLIVFTILALLLIAPQLWYPNCYNGGQTIEQSRSKQRQSKESKEPFATGEKLSVDRDVSGTDPDFHGQKTVHPKGKTSDYESLIFDNTTGAIMTGSQFMDNTGVIAPLWIAPAWDPDAYGPSSKGELDPEDYENDPRMLYNKCSLSCCSPQYPTPFKGDVDPFTCGANGNSKYLSSDYTCTNNTGGTGCLCITEKQAEGMRTGYVDYY
jgi:hypothetical protein